MSNEQQFLLLIDAMSDKDDTTRKNAEQTLMTASTGNPQAFIAVCVAIIRNESLTLLQRKMTTLLLKKSLYSTDGSECIYKRLSAEEQAQVRRELLVIIATLKDETLKGLIAGLVGNLAAGILEDSSIAGTPETRWPELIPHLFELYQAGEGFNRTAVFLILDPVFASSMTALKSYITQFPKLFEAAFVGNDNKTKLAAMEAFVTFVQAIKRKDLKHVKSLKPLLQKYIVQLITTNDTEDLEQAFAFIIDLADVEPSFFKNEIDQWIEIAAKMRGLESESDSIFKTQGIEFIIPIIEAFPNLVTSNLKRLTDITNIIVQNMLEVSDEVSSEWQNPPEGFNDELEEQDDQKEIKFGISTINNLFEIVGDKEMFAFLTEYLKPFVASPDWKHRHAAIMILSQSGEYIQDHADYIKNIVTFVGGAAKDANPRVRYACCHLLGQFSDDMSIRFQEAYFKEYFAIVIPLLDDPVPRVVAHCMASLTNFLENSTKDQIAPYIQALYSKIYNWILNGSSFVKEAALSAMSALFEGSPQLMVDQIDQLMSVVFTILQKADSNLLKVLKGNAIECGTIICKYSPAEKFDKYADPLIQEMIKVTKSDVSHNSFDPQKSFLLSGFQRLASTIPRKLELRLEELVGLLFEMARQSTVEAQTSQSAAQTSTSEEAELALHMISSFIQNMPDQMVRYENHIYELAVAIIDNIYNEEVRISAIEVLCLLAKLYKNKPTASNQQVLRKIIDKVWSLIDNEVSSSSIIDELYCLQKIFKYSENCFTEQELLGFYEKCKTVIKKSVERKNGMHEDIDEEDDMDEIGNAVEENAEMEETLQLEVANLIGSMFRSHKATALPTFNRSLTELIAPALSLPEGLKFALFLICDSITYLGQFLPPDIIAGFIKTLVTHHSNPDLNVKQSCVFGLGSIASVLGDKFQPYFEQAFSTIKAVAATPAPPKSSATDHKSVLENCISAEGKIIKALWNQIPPQALPTYLEAWLNGLPLISDHKEGVINLEMLIQILKNTPQVLLTQPKNIGHICDIFATVYNQRKISTPEIDAEIKSITMGFLANEHLKTALAGCQVKDFTKTFLEKITKT